MRSFRAASGNLSSRAQPRDLRLPLVRARFQPCRFGPHKNLSSRPARPGFFLRTLFVRRVAERRDLLFPSSVSQKFVIPNRNRPFFPAHVFCARPPQGGIRFCLLPRLPWPLKAYRPLRLSRDLPPMQGESAAKPRKSSG